MGPKSHKSFCIKDRLSRQQGQFFTPAAGRSTFKKDGKHLNKYSTVRPPGKITDLPEVQYEGGFEHFKLLYIPTKLSRADILKKLTIFGPVASFTFSRIDACQHGRGPQVQPHTHQNAIFSFQEESSALEFGRLKRVRIAGLQIRVEKISCSLASLATCSLEQQSSEASQGHDIRPTSRQYFACRPAAEVDSLNYYWRFAASCL